MVAPNLNNYPTNTVVFNSDVTASLTITESTLLSNGAASNQIFKINRITVLNKSSSSATLVTVSLKRSTVNYAIASTISIPVVSSLELISKETAFYLEEGDSIVALASAAGNLDVTISYEVFS